MAYLPVEFDLHEFQLSLNTMQSANFHKRLKELGFDSNQSGDVLTYGRGKSRITAFVKNGAELDFLPDFFDDTPGGTVYAILEKMCVAFGGTMIGQYSIPSIGQTWDIRISQGMNLSGRPDVGQRDHVAEEDENTPSSGQQSAQPASPQQATTQMPRRRVKEKPKPVSDGEVQEGQSGESSRDKLYRVLVEETYAKYVEANGADVNHFLELVKNFNAQFPKEGQETQEAQEEINEDIVEVLGDYLGTGSQSIRKIVKAIDEAEREGHNVVKEFLDSDDFNLGPQEVEAVIKALRQSLKAPTKEQILGALKKFAGLQRDIDNATLAYELDLLIDNGESVVENVADITGFDEDKIEEVLREINASDDDEDEWEDEEF